MADTRTTLGDQETLDALVSMTLEDFEESGVSTVANNALYQNLGLKTVKFPNLTNTNSGFMYNCRNLESVNIQSCTTIGSNAFYGCWNLKNLTAPALTSIQNSAFQDCWSLNGVDTSAVTTVSSNAFYRSGVGKLELPVCTLFSSQACYGERMSVIDFTKPITISSNMFANTFSLTHLILRSETLCALSATNAFTSTPIAIGIGYIYVPTDLVDTYKAATNWSTYASQIVPISEYPKTLQDETISDNWSDIFTAESDGTYSSKYSVGDIKYLDVGGTTLPMQIIAMDTDVLSDNSGAAKITWLSKGFLGYRNMNSTNITTDGWAACDMRDWLRNVIYPQIDSTVRGNIKSVNKTYKDVTSSSTLTVVDTVWIPSYREMFGGTSYENSGIDYTSFFTDNTSRIKKYGIGGSAYRWWLRSAYSATGCAYVSNSGSYNYNGASNSYGAALGFCT